MEHIIEANSTTLGILGKPRPSGAGLRMLKYCLSLPTENGILLYNLLTREMLILSPEEYNNALSSEYLKERWFTIPENMDEKELVELWRWVVSSQRKKAENITSYTILTTTDCNARCFYCYERGCAKVSMSSETANKVVGFIRDNCGGEEVSICWFGGEPLMNVPVIDQICEGLNSAGVKFRSQMITNAYLFDDELAEKASGLWKLKHVQITLDGTEEIYNRSKAFIYKNGSAYQVVLANIRRLLDSGIPVVIRLNMDLNNAENLLILANELVQRFKGQKLLRIYSHLLFDTGKTWDKRYSPEEWKSLYNSLCELEAFLCEQGFLSGKFRRLRRELPLSHCMADNGHAVVIVPDGHLGLCEHFTDSEFFGHIDSSQRNPAMISSWRERCEPIAECENCFYFPECLELKKCTGRTECFEFSRAYIKHNIELAMLNEYQLWLSSKRQEQVKI